MLRLGAFPLHSPAMKEHKTQRKQSEEEGVFLRFGDDLAAHGQAQGMAGKIGMRGGLIGSGIELAHIEVGQNAGPAPRDGLGRGIEIILADANSQIVVAQNRLAVKSDAGNGERVGLGNGDCGGGIAFGQSVWIVSGEGAEGRKRADDSGQSGDRVKILDGKGVRIFMTSRCAGSDGFGGGSGGVSAEDEDGVVGIAGAGADGQHQLRLAVFRDESQRRR